MPTHRLGTKTFACCGRQPLLREYLLRDERGVICVGCFLAGNLEAQNGPNPQADAVRGTPLLLDPAKVEALKKAASEEV